MSDKTAYERDLDALRLIHRDWDSKSDDDKQAIHHTFMVTVQAAVDAGIVAFPTTA